MSFTAGCWNTFQETSEIWIHEGHHGSAWVLLWWALLPSHSLVHLYGVVFGVWLTCLSYYITTCIRSLSAAWCTFLCDHGHLPFYGNITINILKLQSVGFSPLFCVFLLLLNLSYVQNFCRFFSHTNLIPFSHYLTTPFFPLEQVVLLKCNRFL